MAVQPPVGKLGESWSGLATTGTIPDEIRNSRDEAGKLVYITRDISKFNQIIRTRWGKSSLVDDRVYSVRELTELDRTYDVTVASGGTGDTYHQKIGVSNEQGAQIQERDILFVKGIYAKTTWSPLVKGQVYAASGGSQGTNIGPDFNTDMGGNPTAVLFSKTKGTVNNEIFLDYEQVMVRQVDSPNSAGTGHRYIYLERFYCGPHALDKGGRRVSPSLVNSGIAAYPIDSKIDVGMVLLRGTPCFVEGSQAPNGVHKNIEIDKNVTQEIKYAVEETNESRIVSSRLKETPMEINKWLTTRRLTRDMDYQMLLGRKTAGSESDGKEWYIVGGVREFILKDSQHYLRYPQGSLSWPGMLDMGRDIFKLGGSESRIGFTSITMDTEFRKMFYNDGHMRFDKAASDAFNIEINSLIVSGGKIMLIPTQILEEAGFEREILCLDMSNKDAFEPVGHAGWDMVIRSGIQEKGLEVTKDAIIHIFGLKRRYRQFHTILDFSQAS